MNFWRLEKFRLTARVHRAPAPAAPRLPGRPALCPWRWRCRWVRFTLTAHIHVHVTVDTSQSQTFQRGERGSREKKALGGEEKEVRSHVVGEEQVVFTCTYLTVLGPTTRYV